MWNRQDILRWSILVLFTWMMIPIGCTTTHPIDIPSPIPSQTKTHLSPTRTTSPSAQVDATPTPTVLPGCTETQGTVSRETIHSDVLPGRMVFSLYLPPCYDASKTYPELFLLHGLTYNDDQWIRLGAVQTADEKISADELQPFIMVFPYNPDSKQPADTNFTKAVIQSLVPWVDTHFSNCDKPSCRWIGGLSRGGGWAFDIFIRAEGAFGKLGGHSPALFNHDLKRMVEKIQTTWHGEAIWIDVGQDDKEVGFLQALHDGLLAVKIDNQFVVHPGNHTEAYWKAHVAEYLEWYAGTRSD